MKKKDVLKRTKFTTNTYMREAIDYEIAIFNKEDYFVTIKKYNNVSNDFSITDGTKTVKYIANEYYLVEITPLNENYNIRYYVDNNKNVLDYYVDITYENGVKYKIPYYVDLYLDIIHYPISNKIEYADQDELLDALNNKIISKKDYDFAYKVGNKLLKEIKDNKNKYLKLDIISFINKYFKEH